MSNYSNTILADTPVAYWRLGEASGITAADSSGNSYTGTCLPNSGGTWLSGGLVNQTGALSTDSDTCYYFAGAPYVSTATLGSFGSSLGSGCSVEFWVKSTSTSVGALLGCRSADSKKILGIRINCNYVGVTNAGFMRVIFSDNSTPKYLVAGTSSSVSINDGNWHHVVITINPPTNTIQVYVDNDSKAVTYQYQQTPDTFANYDYPLMMGAENYAGSAGIVGAGYLDEVAIYSGILSSTRINAHYLAATQSYQYKRLVGGRISYNFEK